MKNNKGHVLSRVEGFTLIEMLVVIAIIGLLSSVVLVALGPSRNKAKDARIVSDINQIRAVMETLFVPTSGTYSITPVSNSCAGGSGSADINKALVDIGTNGGTNCTINLTANSTGYAISAVLNISSAIYCADSTGKFGVATAAAGVCP